MDGWKISFLLGRPIFGGYVKLWGGTWWVGDLDPEKIRGNFHGNQNSAGLALGGS